MEQQDCLRTKKKGEWALPCFTNLTIFVSRKNLGVFYTLRANTNDHRSDKKIFATFGISVTMACQQNKSRIMQQRSVDHTLSMTDRELINEIRMNQEEIEEICDLVSGEMQPVGHWS